MKTSAMDKSSAFFFSWLLKDNVFFWRIQNPAIFFIETSDLECYGISVEMKNWRTHFLFLFFVTFNRKDIVGEKAEKKSLIFRKVSSLKSPCGSGESIK